MLYDTALVLVGLVALFLGGEGLVRGAVELAERLGASKLLIGLVVVGFGTSMPELLVSIGAALGGTPDIAIGNVIGSSTANVLLIIGASAAISAMTGWHRSARREAVVGLLFAVLALALMLGGEISRIEGLAMIVLLVSYLIFTYRIEMRNRATSENVHEAEELLEADMSLPMSLIFTVAGMAALAFGADMLVKGSVSIARTFGVDDAVIGLSIVAVGTSLPELATGIVAAIRRHSDVVLGNVIGSNIFNLAAIPGITALILPIGVDPRIVTIDGPIMLVAVFGLTLVVLAFKSISRRMGAAMLAAYAIYMVTLF